MVGRPSPGFAESGLLFSISESGESLRGRITVVHLTLDQVVEVRVLAPQPHRFRCRPHRLARPRTPPSQGGNAGSNPAGATNIFNGLATCRGSRWRAVGHRSDTGFVPWSSQKGSP